MDEVDQPGSSDSSRSLTPPQSRIPLSSCMSSLALDTTSTIGPPKNVTLPKSLSRAPILSAMVTNNLDHLRTNH